MALQFVDAAGLETVLGILLDRIKLKADKADLTTAVRFMGSVPTYAELPTSGNRTGDMWNVEEDGSNYCWTANGEWDDLTGILDLSAYYTIAEAEAAFVMLKGDQTIHGAKTFTNNVTLDSNSRLQFLNVTTYSDIMASERADINGRIAAIRMSNGVDDNKMMLYVTRKGTEGGSMSNMGGIIITGKGDIVEVTAPSPSDPADNSVKIATTQWVNIASSVVHTTGNETLAGVKTLLAVPICKSTIPGYKMINSEQDSATEVTAYKNFGELSSYYSDNVRLGRVAFHGNIDGKRWVTMEVVKDVDGETKSSYIRLNILPDGTAYASAPATRTTGYETTDIVTAGWVDSKIAAVTATAVTQQQIQDIIARLDALEAGA